MSKHPAQIIEEIAAVSGRNEKIAILEANKDNEELKAVLEATYNKSYNWYITSVPKNVNPLKSINTLAYAITILKEQLATRKVSGKKAKTLLEGVYSTLCQDDQKCLGWIIKRDVKCGINEKTILKVFPNLFPVFPYMRCSSKGEVKYPAISDIKADGLFSRWIVRESTGGKEVTAHTRSGTPLINIPQEVINDFLEMPLGVYEGEILIQEGEDVLPREKGNGLVNAYFISGKRDVAEDHKLYLQLWDTLPEEDFWAGKYDKGREIRLAALQGIINYCSPKNISLIPFKVVNNKREAMEHYQEVVSKGYEGTVIKEMDAIWKDGTSKGQVKNKLEEIVELRIVGYNPAKEGSKNEDTFGSLLCESRCGKLKVSATGIKDDMRRWIHENKDYCLDKVVSIKSNGPIQNNNEYSLFLPRFVELRDHDKTEANTLEEILEVFNV